MIKLSEGRKATSLSLGYHQILPIFQCKELFVVGCLYKHKQQITNNKQPETPRS
jgi:hypothetical protein